MNWQRGLKRITLLASIVCAPWAGFYTYQDGASSFPFMERELVKRQKATFDDPSSWVETYQQLFMSADLEGTDLELRKLGATPVDADEKNWQIWHEQKTRKLEDYIRADKHGLLIFASIVTVAVFAAPWAIFGLLSWIGRGFVAGSSKGDEEPTPRQPGSPE